jgi:hypothetical protein
MYIKFEGVTGITKSKWLAYTIQISLRYQSQIYFAKCGSATHENDFTL